MAYRPNRAIRIGYLGIAATIFLFVFLSILSSSLFVLDLALSDQKKVDRGRELTNQYCHSCHSFNKETSGGEININTADFSDGGLKERIKHNPSGIFPKDEKDQYTIIKYLRSEEQKGRHN